MTNLKNGTSDECCFENHNIVMENVEFNTGGNATAAAIDLFVS